MSQFSYFSRDTPGPLEDDQTLQNLSKDGWRLCVVHPSLRPDCVQMHFLREQGVARYWEYEVVKYDGNTVQPQILAERYSLGWEVVAVIRLLSNTTACYYARERK